MHNAIDYDFTSYIKNLASSFRRLTYTDELIESVVNRKLNDIYYEVSKEKNNIERKIKKTYRHSSSYGRPFIDENLYKQVRGHNSVDYPKTIHIPSDQEVHQETIETIQRFQRKCRDLSKYESESIIRAGVEAARALGISKFRTKGEKNFHKTLSQKSSVERSIKNTNSGWPLFRKKTFPACIIDTKIWIKELFERPTLYKFFKNPLIENPSVIFKRFQISVSELENSEVKVKIRDVFAIPQRIIALENYFFGNILDSYHETSTSSFKPICSSGLTNFEISTRIISRLRNYIGLNDGKLYSIDYSKFDSTVPDYAIDIFFLIVKSSLNLNTVEERIFDYLRYYVKRTPLVYKDKFYILSRGICSGLLITNMFDSWWNLTLWQLSYRVRLDSDYYGVDPSKSLRETLLTEHKYHVILPEREDISVCGDDVLVFTTMKEVNIHKFITESHGMSVKINIVCKKDDDLTYFLGRYWNQYSEPVQSELYMSAHIIFRSKWYKKEEVKFDISKDLDLFRVLSICCPLSNGLDYLEKAFYDWKPLQNFIDYGEKFTLLKEEWSQSGYTEKSRSAFLDWKSL